MTWWARPAQPALLAALSDPDLTRLLHEGRPLKGMPGRLVPEPEMGGLVKFLRALQRESPASERRTAEVYPWTFL